MKLSVLSGGVTLPTVHHGQETILVAPVNAAYEVVLVNDSMRRRLAVLTIDGLSTIDGKNGSYNSGGYVLEPGERRVVKGWHRDTKEVAAFRFASSGASYTAQMGSAANESIIAVAVFDERNQPRPKYRLPENVVTRGGGGRRAMKSAPISSDLGTGYGKRVQSRTTLTTFERATSAPSFVVSLRYATLACLVAQGIVDVLAGPSAFPDEGCPAPAGWVG